MACFSLGFLLCLVLLGIALQGIVSRDALEQTRGAALQQMRQADAALVSMERLLKADFVRMAGDMELRLGSGLTVYSEEAGGESGILEMDPEAKGGFELRAYQMFRKFAKEHEKVTAAVTYGMRDGGYVQYPAVSREQSFDPRKLYWYRDGMAAGESGLLFVSKPFQGSGGKPVIGFYALVWTLDEEPLGVLGLQLDLAALLDMALPENGGSGSGWMVLDGEDAILIDGKHPDALFRKISDADLGDISLTGQKKEGIHRIQMDGVETYAVIHASQVTGLKYIRLVDGEEAMAGVRDVRMALFAFFLLAAVMSFFGSHWLARRITAPFRAMEEKAEAIGSGCLRGAAELSESDDEVGRLSLAFQEMAGGLRRKLEGVKQEAEGLSALSRQLGEDIAACRKASAEIIEKTGAMTAAGEKQTQTAAEAAGQMAELAESLQRASEGVKEIGRATRQLGQAASDGGEGLADAEGRMEKAGVRTAAALQAGELLDKKALQATELIRSIEEMSEQLNLLALNAAVESARTGNSKERSKFAAVAEEVRQLSEQSGKAAHKAVLAISALRQEAQQSAAAVKETEDAVASGRDCLRERQEDFSRLGQQLAHMEEVLAGVASAVQSLDGSGKRIKAAAEQVEWAARKSADAAESVTGAAGRQAQTLGKMGKLSSDLAGAAEKLREQAKGFEL